AGSIRPCTRAAKWRTCWTCPSGTLTGWFGLARFPAWCGSAALSSSVAPWLTTGLPEMPSLPNDTGRPPGQRGPAGATNWRDGECLKTTLRGLRSGRKNKTQFRDHVELTAQSGTGSPPRAPALFVGNPTGACWHPTVERQYVPGPKAVRGAGTRAG